MKRFHSLSLIFLGAAIGCAPASDNEHAADSPAVDRAPHESETRFSGLRQLTFGGQNAEAYFSSDGEQLIFQRTFGEQACDQQFTMNIDGSDMRMVSNGLGRTTCGYFYQNDDRILYSSTFRHDEACPAPPDFSRGYVWPLANFEIYTSSADGNDLVQLTNNDAYDAEGTLSPDGSRIVFTSTRDGDIDIYSMNVDGSDVQRLTDRVGYDGGPFYSPDGTKIIYRAMYPETEEAMADYQSLLAQNMVRPSRMEIWIMDAEGTNHQQVTDLGGANFAPYFHPDGQRVIFSSNHHNEDPRSRNFDLFLINIDGTGLEQVTFDDDFDGFPMFSPDGTKLVFAGNRHGEVEGETNIFIADWIE